MLKPMHDHSTELIKFTNNDRSGHFLWENDYTVPPPSIFIHLIFLYSSNLENANK